jgi:hypothetical protein
VLWGRCPLPGPPERRRLVGELFARGAGTAEIAARLGLPRGTVANDIYVLRARGELRPARPQGFGSALEQQLIALYEDGWPLREIARSLGRHKRTITRQLARLRASGRVDRRAPAREPRPPAPLPASPPAPISLGSSASSRWRGCAAASSESRARTRSSWRARGSL